MAEVANSAEETTRGARIVKSFAREPYEICLLYTSDAADERSSVDLGGRRIIKKKKYQCVERKHRTDVKDSAHMESDKHAIGNTHEKT